MFFVRNMNFLSSVLVRNKGLLPKMKIEKMTPIISSFQEEAAARAAHFLLNDDVIAIPTDTIYGLACSANCPDAIKKLYAIKGRDSAKPVAICVSCIADVRKWGEADYLSDELLRRLLPGPVTIVLEKSKWLDNPFLNPATTKIGIRIPDHNFVNELTKIFDKPVALTSANFSNEPSTLCIKEFENLFDHLGAVFDGGILSLGLDHNRTGSTVIDLSKQGFYKVIRRGTSYDQVVQIVDGFGLISS